MQKEHIPELAQIKIRLSQALKDDIEMAAADRGVSMNVEIGDRLSRSASFLNSNNRIDNPEVYALSTLIMHVVNDVLQTSIINGRFQDYRTVWYDDPNIYAQVVASIDRVLEHLKPHGNVDYARSRFPNIISTIGRSVADDWILGIRKQSEEFSDQSVPMIAIRKKFGRMLSNLDGRTLLDID